MKIILFLVLFLLPLFSFGQDPYIEDQVIHWRAATGHRFSIDLNTSKFRYTIKIGETIKYYDSDYYGGKDGAVKSIGDVVIKYYDSDYYGGKKGAVESIGNIEIEYYDSDYYGGKKGAVKSIGDLKFKYYDSNYYGGKKGYLKETEGSIY